MNILEQLRRDEDEVLHAYPDSLGYLTIGMGRLIDARKGGGITHEESAYLARNDVARVTTELRDALPWFDSLDDARQGVLINMAFNLGTPHLLGFHHMLERMQAKDWLGAKVEMLDSIWAAQVGQRAQRLAKQMETGIWQ